MSFKKLATGFLSILAVATLASCGAKATKEDAKIDGKEKLVVQFVPTNNDGSMEAKTKPFAEYLSKVLNREVSVTLATDYSTIVEAMASGQVDIGVMPPAAYVQAKDMDAAEAILTSQLEDMDLETGLPLEGKLTNTFKGEILVKADSDINKLTDLKGKKIATLSPNSASGYIYPVAEMKDAGVDPTIESTLTTVNDIPSEITAVLNGQIDAAFVFEGARNVFGSAFPDKDLFKELKVLYLTEGDIPNDAIAVQPSMDAKLKEQIKEAFLNMKDDEQGAEAMTLWSHLGYEEAADSAYDTIREYTEKAAE
ncbi:phosphate/phosphite/phosphonate ABC transporter substrate-binding protein [Carnobacterium sp.]|uniref:phosphate/phosphite/phosphonate ABC transporter substrate-binding protein n=1 Tax=Carnobacterium sp. TaxID=48221 RepID=UPI0028AB04CA|nr:phosphate/phosphite/phosphonate ABC transporter substrate-binding protein [Carnobacterium sp.]